MNWLVRTCGIGVLASLPSVAFAELDVQNTRYSCDRGVQVPVVYVNSPDTSIAVLTVDGNQILLYAEASGSGAKYGWPSGGSNYVWWSEGSKAMLLWRDGAANTEITVLADCNQS